MSQGIIHRSFGALFITGSAILLEIHQNQTQEPYLRTFYLNVTESESPFELELKDCPQTWTSGAKKAVCTLTSFRQMVSDLIPGNWEEECGNTIKANTDGGMNSYCLSR